MADPADRLSTAVRIEIWSLLATTDRTQVWLATETKLTTKHINHMLQGRIRISCEMAERMLACFGRQLAISTAPIPGQTMPAPLIKTIRRGRHATPPAAPGETGDRCVACGHTKVSHAYNWVVGNITTLGGSCIQCDCPAWEVAS